MDHMLTSERADWRADGACALLFDAHPQPMWVFDRATLDFLAVNDAAVEHYGYTREEFLGMIIGDIRPPEDLLALHDHITRSSQGSRPVTIWRHLTKSGESIDVEIRTRALPLDGRDTVLVLATDVSAWRRIEARSVLNEMLLRAMEKSSTLGLVVVDDVDEILYFNNRAFEIWGIEHLAPSIERGELSGSEVLRTCASLTKDPAAFLENLERERTLGGSESDVALADGRTIRRIKTQVPETGGRISGTCVFLEDVTERHRIEDELRRQAIVFEAMGEGVLITDTEQRITDWNAAAEQMYGYSGDELRGRHPLALLPTAEDRSCAAAIAEAIARDGRWTGELPFARKDGCNGVAEVTIIEHRGRCGTPLALVGITRDISARRRAEEALREQQARMERILHCIADGFFLLDGDWRFAYVNPEAERHLGRSAGDLIGRSIWDLYPGFEETTFAALYRAVAESRKPGGLLDYYAPNGVWYDVHAYPVDEGITVHFRDVTERQRALEALRETEERFRLVARATNDAVYDWNVATNRAFWGDAIHSTFRYPEGAVEPTYAWWASRVHPEDRPGVEERLSAALDGDTQFLFDSYRFLAGDGVYANVLDRGFIVRDEAGKAVRMVGTLMDLTERDRTAEALREKEEQLRQAQKMEAVGRLAGGVAHDFNNLLTVISGYCDLALRNLGEQDPLRADLVEVSRASARATALTRQLLAFSRKQFLQPKVLDLNEVIAGMGRMLERLIGEDVELVVELAPEPARVLADPNQLEQVIANLAVNARDAMPTGGRLQITTALVTLDAAARKRFPDVEPGPCVVLTVTDTGCGMDDETLAHVFEPFFTTKETGKGTGLGLSTVYGIVKQSGGGLEATSEPEKGTTFTVLLRCVDAATSPREAGDDDAGELAGRGATVLVVEDEVEVRGIAVKVLRLHGYNVLEACNGGEAFLIAEQFEGPIDLILSDVVMPRMSGIQLAERLRSMRPEARIVLMSGYSDDAVLCHGLRDDSIVFIAKPFTPNALARKVRDELRGHAR